MQNFKQYFAKGQNADDDFELIGEGQFINSRNMRFGSTDKGAVGRIETINGTLEILNPYLPIVGVNTCIGGCSDESGNRLFYFIYNSLGHHAIYCHDKTLDEIFIVLLDTQVEGGLNFDKNFRINKNAKVIAGQLPFTDYNNEPRKLDIEAAISANTAGYTADYTYNFPLKYTELTLIKKPPIYPLDVLKYYDSAYDNNYVKDNAYQITYRYRFFKYERSVLAAYSNLVPYNSKDESSNSVIISLSFSEHIDDEVQAIDLCVKYGNTGKTFIVKTWDRDSDSAAIIAHNSNTTALSFTFYDDLIGIALDDVTSNTSFDTVPLIAKTLEIATNRLFLGKVKLGYDTPRHNNLSLTLAEIDIGATGSYTGKWGFVTLHGNFPIPIQDTYMFPFVQIDPGQGQPHDFYYFSSVRSSTIWNGGLGPVPPTIFTYEATFSGPDEASLVSYLKATNYPHGSQVPGSPVWDLAYDINYNGFGGSSAVTVSEFTSIQVHQFFKSGGAYLVNIAYYDRFRRKCGVIKNGVKITIPERTYSQTAFNAAVQWQLDNTDALSEIPDWAYYYQIHITKNLTQQSFIQARAVNSQYVSKEQDGTYTYLSDYVYLTTYAIGIDISALPNFGIGYVFTEGDMMKIFTSGVSRYEEPILGQDGNFVLIAPDTIATLPQDLLFEIYTPYKSLTTTPYYETGPVYQISNPGTASRAYSVLTGLIGGDCYAVERDIDISTSYIVEAMSPNDRFWNIWQRNAGWVNAIDTIGQKLLTGSFVFSDVLINGTKVNGLNVFQPDNIESLGSENGAIQKLQLASKVQTDGSILLAICEIETVSCYLGEQEIFDTQGNSIVVRSTGVIGTIKSLRGSFGTSHPESVFEFNGLVEWFDKRNGCFVQYAQNGLYPISKNKMVRAAHLLSLDLLDGQLVVGGCDPYHKEFLFSIPKTLDLPPKGYLEDYEDIIYPYDIYDGQAKTLVYKYEADQWRGSQEYSAEEFICLGNELFSLSEGVLYKHNSDTDKIYGKTYKSAIMFSCNPPGAAKTYEALGLQSDIVPSFVHFRTEDPYVQSSDLVLNEFGIKEGVKYSPLRRDRLDPNKEGSYIEKQMSSFGGKLFGKYLLVMLEFESKAALKFSNIEHEINEGHFINK